MKKYYPQLDGWRGIAILWIVVGHVAGILTVIPNGIFTVLFRSLVLNYLTVDIFFLITGFLIAGIVLEDRRFDPKRFISSRAVRIVPLYFVTLLLLLIIPQLHYTSNISYVYNIRQVSDAHYTARMSNLEEPVDVKILRNPGGGGALVGFYLGDKLLANIRQDDYTATIKTMTAKGAMFTLRQNGGTVRNSMSMFQREGESLVPFFVFLQNYMPYDSRPQLSSHLWFVAVIAHFYLLFGATVYFAGGRIKDARRRRRVFIWGILALIAGVIVVRWISMSFFSGAHRYYEMTHLRLDAVLAGCLLRLLEDYYPKNRPVVQAVIFVCGAAIWAYIVSGGPYTQVKTPFLFVFSYVGFALMMAGAYGGSKLSELVLENRVIRWVGRYSYGIYLVHVPLLGILFYSVFSDRSTYLVIVYLALSVALGASLELGANRLVGYKRGAGTPEG